MPYEIVERDGTRIAVISGGAAQIRDASSALDLAMSIRYETGISRLAIDKEALCGDFFILSTGGAGEILQKFSNYRLHQQAAAGLYPGVQPGPGLLLRLHAGGGPSKTAGRRVTDRPPAPTAPSRAAAGTSGGAFAYPDGETP